VHPLVLATDIGELSKEYMAIARSLNVKVITDDKKGNLEEWKKILKMGIDGIQTDDPEKLIQYLKEIN
jgi:glycerophosphoryl diester phosphodiesterase